MSKNSTTAVEIAENAKLPTVTLHNGVPTVSSLDIADIFSKRHDNVTRDIKDLEVPEDFRLLNFEESSYQNQQNKKQPCFNITQDGFTVLAMGFTGKKAMEFKLAYIAEFNRMKNELSGDSNKRIDELAVLVGKLSNKVNIGKRPVGRPRLTENEKKADMEYSYTNSYLAKKFG